MILVLHAIKMQEYKRDCKKVTRPKVVTKEPFEDSFLQLNSVSGNFTIY